MSSPANEDRAGIPAAMCMEKNLLLSKHVEMYAEWAVEYGANYNLYTSNVMVRRLGPAVHTQITINIVITHHHHHHSKNIHFIV